jgi:hypothetical protein
MVDFEKRKQSFLLVWIILEVGFFTACSTLGSSVTPTLEFAPTPTFQTLVYEPTNPAGFDFPFNLLNITLSCTSARNYLLEFDYLPPDIIIDSVSDLNNIATNLTCAYRTTGHGVCSGNIDFGPQGVASLQVCQGRSSLTRVCISQTVRPAECPPAP